MVIPPPAPKPALARRPGVQFTLEFAKGAFVVGKKGKKEAVPLALEAAAKSELSFRKDKRWAVWDKRGLTTRDGDWTATDGLEAIPVSRRVRTKAEILATLAKVKSGKRTREASGLSGARRIGGMAYFLPRWDEADGTPWFEALVAIDLTKPHPKPRLLGTFGGLSLGRGLIDDRLGIDHGLLTVDVNESSAWGTATFDPKTSRFDFHAQGVRLLALDGDRVAEATAYGTTLVGRRSAGRTIPWLELRGAAEFVPGEGTVLVRSGDRLRNATSGAVLRLAPNASLRRTGAGLLVFWPAVAPRSARLFDAARFEELARWEKETKDQG